MSALRTKGPAPLCQPVPPSQGRSIWAGRAGVGVCHAPPSGRVRFSLLVLGTHLMLFWWLQGRDACHVQNLCSPFCTVSPAQRGPLFQNFQQKVPALESTPSGWGPGLPGSAAWLISSPGTCGQVAASLPCLEIPGGLTQPGIGVGEPPCSGGASPGGNTQAQPLVMQAAAPVYRGDRPCQGLRGWRPGSLFVGPNERSP